MKRPKLIFVEGARNCGKTFLIQSLSLGLQTYKFPFAKYFNECYARSVSQDADVINDRKVALNGRKELFYLTLGYDITILDLYKQGIIKESLVVDRGILSDIIFGIQSGRIGKDEAVESWKWLESEYGEFFDIVFIESEIKKDDRNKDMWELYDASSTVKIYNDFLRLLNIRYHPVSNTFDQDGVRAFNETISNLL